MNSADLVARLRAATMSFDWCDLSVDALIPAVPILREAADRIEALEAWKAEVMEVLLVVAAMPSLGHVQTAARRLVEREDGRHG